MTHAAPITVDDALLRAWPLPMPASDGDKEERGRILLIGGSPQMPGAIILGANAALRAGAGKLAMATARAVARLVAAKIPEAKVMALDENDDGNLIDGALYKGVHDVADRCDSVVIGPGFEGDRALLEDVADIVPLFRHACIVLDAYAMEAMPLLAERRLQGLPPIVLTPHAGEMAKLTGLSKQRITDDPDSAARELARKWKAVVALKGARTVIAHPDGRLWQHTGGNVGLAISGSGDTLAGIIGGLAARGATPEQATVWGVALHAQAGEALAERIGPLGYLAREIADEVPRLMHALAPPAA